jgi:hypothetical protein
MVKASGNPKTPQFATGALGAPKSNSANKSVTYGWSGRGDLNARPPAPKNIGSPHLRINRFNNLQGKPVESCGNLQLQFLLRTRNFDSKTTDKTSGKFWWKCRPRKPVRSFQGWRRMGAPLLFQLAPFAKGPPAFPHVDVSEPPSCDSWW